MPGDWYPILGDHIPSGSLLTSELLHFMLDDADRDFVKTYPDFPYCRFLHEAFVPMEWGGWRVAEIDFENRMNVLFKKLSLPGQIELLQLDEKTSSLSCLGGELHLTPKGGLSFVAEQAENPIF